MSDAQRARAMRAERQPFAAIAKTLGVHIATAYRHAGDVVPYPQEDADSVVRSYANNGGCSTTSGMLPIRMPRIRALHGEMAVAA